MPSVFSFLRRGLLQNGASIGYWPPLAAGGFCSTSAVGSRRASGRAESRASGLDFHTQLTVRGNKFEADMPVDGGGKGELPSPKDLAMAGLASCCSMTLQATAKAREFFALMWTKSQCSTIQSCRASVLPFLRLIIGHRFCSREGRQDPKGKPQGDPCCCTRQYQRYAPLHTIRDIHTNLNKCQPSSRALRKKFRENACSSLSKKVLCFLHDRDDVTWTSTGALIFQNNWWSKCCAQHHACSKTFFSQMTHLTSRRPSALAISSGLTCFLTCFFFFRRGDTFSGFYRPRHHTERRSFPNCG